MTTSRAQQPDGGAGAEALHVQIRAARMAAGLSVAEVARRAGTSRAAVACYEAGSVSPSLTTAERLLAVMGASLVVVGRDSLGGGER